MKWHLYNTINLGTILAQRESKWHTELNCSFGSDFWNRTHSLAAGIKNENKMKFIQYQINRNSLFTNYRVNKFKNHKSPNCQNEEVTLSFPLFDTTDHLWSMTCEVHVTPELVSHLFYLSTFVLKLWTDVKGLAQYAWYWHTLGFNSNRKR